MAESSDPGWLGLFFGDERQDRRRLTLAIACAIALNIIGLGIFLGLSERPQPDENERIANVAVLRISKVKATPTPKPSPPVKAVHVLATVTDPGRSARVEKIKRPAAAAPKTVTKYHSKPIVSIPVGGQGAGTGAKGTTGSLGTGGTGNGAEDAGNGSGGICGAVDFVSSHAASFDASTGLYIYDGMQMVVHYSDGTAKTITLDYPWHYRDPAMDPFTHPDGAVPVFFQFPPKAMRANEPADVQYVMAHSTIEGSTEIDPCPGQAPPQR